MRTTITALATLLVALSPSLADADPLAVLCPSSGAAQPTDAQRTAIANAVSTVLAEHEPNVLSGADTRSRIELLDNTQLACATSACVSTISSMLHARGVVLILPTVNGASLRLDLVAIDASGAERARVHGDATIADWDDALALARVDAGRLADRVHAAERPAASPVVHEHASPQAASSLPPAPSEPLVHAQRTESRPAEAGAGVALAAVGIGASIVGIVGLAEGTRCEGANCNPDPSTVASPPATIASPSPYNYVWIAAGALGLVAGVVLAVDGLRAHTVEHARGPSRQILAGWLPGGATIGFQQTF